MLLSGKPGIGKSRLTAARLKRLGVLLIITYRPEFEPPWIGRPEVTALSLGRLGDRETAAIIDGLTGNTPLPESIRQDIAERTDGIPLFIEEMTRAVLEAKSESEARKTTSIVPSSTFGRARKPARLAYGPA